MPFFLHNSTVPAAHGRPGHLDFLPELYEKSGSDGQCFNEALLAVSTGSLARSRHDDGLNRKAMIVYSKALASLRIALSNDELTQQNTTIAAILLLSRFETINDDESPKAGVHFCAGVELMSLRKPQNINTMVGRIFHFMKLELAVRNLCSLGNITGLEPITLSTSPYTMRSFSELLLQAETACLELWAAIHSYSCEKPTEAHLENVEVKVHQALRLEQRLQDFETTLDNAWTYTPVSYSAQEHSITIPVPKEAYIFSGIQLGAQWMALWCAHVRLKDTLAASISASRNTSTHSTVIKRLSNANSGIDKICASMPFMLGELARGDTIPRSCLQVRDVVRVEMRVDEAWEKGVAVPSMVSCASCSAQESFWAIRTSLITIVRGPDKPIPSKTATYLMAVVGWARGLLFQASLCLMLECVCPAKSALTAARCSKMLSWLSST